MFLILTLPTPFGTLDNFYPECQSKIGEVADLRLRSYVELSHFGNAPYWDSHMHQEHMKLYGAFIEALPADTYHEPSAEHIVGM
jgi:hypothetical protein